jgi:hypothetical protein
VNGRARGGSVYCQPGTRLDGNSCHDPKEGFPSKSEEGFPNKWGRDFRVSKRGYQKGVVSMRLSVYIVLIKDYI